MTKHRILIEFEASKPLPNDFTDMVLNRVYTLDAVDKTECTATLVGDVLKDAERYQWLRERHWSKGGPVVTNIKNVQLGSFCPSDILLDETIDSAKDTQ